MAFWEMHEGPSGADRWIQVGVGGAPGSIQIRGLTSEQGEAVCAAFEKIETSAQYGALAEVRKALGIKDTR